MGQNEDLEKDVQQFVALGQNKDYQGNLVRSILTCIDAEWEMLQGLRYCGAASFLEGPPPWGTTILKYTLPGLGPILVKQPLSHMEDTWIVMVKSIPEFYMPYLCSGSQGYNFLRYFNITFLAKKRENFYQAVVVSRMPSELRDQFNQATKEIMYDDDMLV